MATNLAIDPELLDRAVELMGKLEWDDSFNYKAGASHRVLCYSLRRTAPCAYGRRSPGRAENDA